MEGRQAQPGPEESHHRGGSAGAEAAPPCGLEALERPETEQTYLFSKTMVSESSWTSLT